MSGQYWVQPVTAINQRTAAPSTVGADGKPISYRPDVHRQKTQKWVNAKPADYGGDDWGDDDEYEDDGPPAPISKSEASHPVARPRQSSLNAGDRTAPLQVPSALAPVDARTSSMTTIRPPNLQPAQPSDRGRTYSLGQNPDMQPPPSLNPSSRTYSLTQPPSFAEDASRTRSLDSSSQGGSHPPRQSSFHNDLQPPGIVGERPDSSASSRSSGTTVRKLIRPADIYKKLAEQKELARKSQESDRPTSDVAEAVALPPKEIAPQPAQLPAPVPPPPQIQGPPVISKVNPYGGDQLPVIDLSSLQRATPDLYEDRPHEYGGRLETLTEMPDEKSIMSFKMDDDDSGRKSSETTRLKSVTGSLARSIAEESIAEEPKRFSRSPELPDLNFAGQSDFRASLWTLPSDSREKKFTDDTPLPTLPSLPENKSIKHAPSLGLRSAVDRAFDSAGDLAISPVTGSTGSQNSQKRSDEESEREAAPPVPRKPSPALPEAPAGGFRRELQPPNPNNGPARSLALETALHQKASHEVLLSATTPTSALTPISMDAQSAGSVSTIAEETKDEPQELHGEPAIAATARSSKETEALKSEALAAPTAPPPPPPPPKDEEGTAELPAASVQPPQTDALSVESDSEEDDILPTAPLKPKRMHSEKTVDRSTSRGNPSRESSSSHLPSEYDSYWASTEDEFGNRQSVYGKPEESEPIPPVPTLPVIEDHPVLESSAEKSVSEGSSNNRAPENKVSAIEEPSQNTHNLRHRFSWEGDEENLEETLAAPTADSQPGLPESAAVRSLRDEAAAQSRSSCTLEVVQPTERTSLESQNRSSATGSNSGSHSGREQAAVLGVIGVAGVAAAGAATAVHKHNSDSDFVTRHSQGLGIETGVPHEPIASLEPVDAAQKAQERISDHFFDSMSVGNQKVHTFREILANPSPAERIKLYNSASEQIAGMDTGLTAWIALTTGNIPHDQLQYYNNNAALTPNTESRPYYEQYQDSLSHPSQSADDRGASHTGIHRTPAQQVQSKSKDILHSANKLFAKGRSKLRGSVSGRDSKGEDEAMR